MREIKFRGMDISGEWHYGLLSISQGKGSQPPIGCYISNRAGMPWAYAVRPETVGQFTGLLDKNGKEIYEGDIVRENTVILGETSYEILGKIGERSIEQCKKYVVHFQKTLPCGFVAIRTDIYMNPPNKEHSFPFNYSHIQQNCLDSYNFSNNHRDYEVIGNIYENKELLESEKC